MEYPLDGPLDGTEWILVALDGEAIAADDERARVTLRLEAVESRHGTRQDGMRVSGRSGCNRYVGGARIEGASIAFTGIGVTRMACPPPRMLLESRYLAALAGVTRWAMQSHWLDLSGEGISLRFAAQE